MWDFFTRLMRFSLRAGIAMTKAHLRHRFDAVHVHNVPDFLVFCALIPRLTGAKIILDIHDIVPEFFESKFKGGPNSFLKRLLIWVEKLSAAFSHHVIISNHLWYDKITKRSVKPADCSAYINYIDLGAFAPRMRHRIDNRFIVIFPGGLQWHQGLDVAIRAFSLFVKKVPHAEFQVYGKGDQREALEQLVKELHLSDKVKLNSSVPTDRIPALLAEADLGVVPKRANSFGNEAYSTKIMEFMSQGLPVVVSRTKIDSFYFTENEVRFFESENVEDLAKAMLEVVSDEALTKRLVSNGYRYVAENGWGKKKIEYLALVDGLIAGRDKQALEPCLLSAEGRSVRL
jgi:glycosyltransferase involved in cell wall biosynthesis